MVTYSGDNIITGPLVRAVYTSVCDVFFTNGPFLFAGVYVLAYGRVCMQAKTVHPPEQ